MGAESHLSNEKSDYLNIVYRDLDDLVDILLRFYRTGKIQIEIK